MRHILYFFAWLRSIAMTDPEVMRKYHIAGGDLGEMVSYGFMGECLYFKNYLAAWERWEKIYAARGFRTIPLKEFVDSGAGFTPAPNGLGVHRSPGEVPVFYAVIYRKKYLGKLKPVVNLSKNEIQSGEWTPPFDKETV